MPRTSNPEEADAVIQRLTAEYDRTSLEECYRHMPRWTSGACWEYIYHGDVLFGFVYDQPSIHRGDEGAHITLRFHDGASTPDVIHFHDLFVRGAREGNAAFKKRVSKALPVGELIAFTAPCVHPKADSEGALVVQPPGMLYRFGKKTKLPPWPLRFKGRVGMLMAKADDLHTKRLAFHYLTETLTELHACDPMPVTLLEDLAVCCVKLGKSRIAAAYAVAATRLCTQSASGRAAAIAGNLLGQWKCPSGPKRFGAGKASTSDKAVPGTWIETTAESRAVSNEIANTMSGLSLFWEGFAFWEVWPEGSISEAVLRYGDAAVKELKAIGDRHFRFRRLQQAACAYRIALLATQIVGPVRGEAMLDALMMRVDLWLQIEGVSKQQGLDESYLDNIAIAMIYAGEDRLQVCMNLNAGSHDRPVGLFTAAFSTEGDLDHELKKHLHVA